MKIKVITLLIALILPNFVIASDFGEYRYRNYIGIQQQLQSRRMMAMRQQRMSNQSPTRRIQYPTANNPYPNIQRQRTGISPYQRYSPNYYNRYYR